MANDPKNSINPGPIQRVIVMDESYTAASGYNWVWDPSALQWARMTQPSGGQGGGNVVVTNIPTVSVGVMPQISIGTVSVGAMPSLNGTVAVVGTVPVSGSFWQSTQPVSFSTIPTVNVGTMPVVAVTGAFFQATQPVSLQSVPSVNGNVNVVGMPSMNGTVAVAGTVPVSGTFWQATQPISFSSIPTVNVGLMPTVTVASINGTVAVAGTVPVSGTFWQATQPVSMTSVPSHPISSMPSINGTVAVTGTVPVSGTFWQATQPVSGTVTANPATSAGKAVLSFPLVQGAAGTTVVAAASASNKHKILGVILTLSADGTVQFTDGAGNLTGTMDVLAKGGFVIPMSEFPMLETSIANTPLNIVTTGGAARGVIRFLTEP